MWVAAVDLYKTSESGPWNVCFGAPTKKGVAQVVSVCFPWPLTVHPERHTYSLTRTSDFPTFSVGTSTKWEVCSTVIVDSIVQPCQTPNGRQAEGRGGATAARVRRVGVEGETGTVVPRGKVGLCQMGHTWNSTNSNSFPPHLLHKNGYFGMYQYPIFGLARTSELSCSWRVDTFWKAEQMDWNVLRLDAHSLTPKWSQCLKAVEARTTTFFYLVKTWDTPSVTLRQSAIRKRRVRRRLRSKRRRRRWRKCFKRHKGGPILSSSTSPLRTLDF